MGQTPVKHITGTIPRQSGFTLVELLVTITIVSIITAVAWPFYERYRVKAYRSECISAMYMVANDLEKCASSNGGVYSFYSNTCTPISPSMINPQPGGNSALSVNGRCTVNINIPGDGTFTLTGIYRENVVDDNDEVIAANALCGNLILNNLNAKDIGDPDKTHIPYCWDQ